MNFPSLRSWSLLQKRLLVASLCCLPLGAACSSDDTAPAPPVTVTLGFLGLDGSKNGITEPVPLRCDGTLAVDLTLGTEPKPGLFALRPARACASSPHCGYIQVEALDADGQTLASVKTATTGALLQIPLEARAAVAELKASLLRGIDDEPFLNPDHIAVTASISPEFAPTADCPDPNTGAGGAAAGGAAGAATGGAAGETSATGGAGAGAGGVPNVPAGGAGAAGESAVAGAGGI